MRTAYGNHSCLSWRMHFTYLINPPGPIYTAGYRSLVDTARRIDMDLLPINASNRSFLSISCQVTLRLVICLLNERIESAISRNWQWDLYPLILSITKDRIYFYNNNIPSLTSLEIILAIYTIFYVMLIYIILSNALYKFN